MDFHSEVKAWRYFSSEKNTSSIDGEKVLLTVDANILPFCKASNVTYTGKHHHHHLSRSHAITTTDVTILLLFSGFLKYSQH